MDTELSRTVLRLAVAAALGMFVGFERERSEKAAGVRTVALLSLAAAVFVVLERPLLLALGRLLVVVLGASSVRAPSSANATGSRSPPPVRCSWPTGSGPWRARANW